MELFSKVVELIGQCVSVARGQAEISRGGQASGYCAAFRWRMGRSRRWEDRPRTSAQRGERRRQRKLRRQRRQAASWMWDHAATGQLVMRGREHLAAPGVVLSCLALFARVWQWQGWVGRACLCVAIGWSLWEVLERHMSPVKGRLRGNRIRGGPAKEFGATAGLAGRVADGVARVRSMVATAVFLPRAWYVGLALGQVLSVAAAGASIGWPRVVWWLQVERRRGAVGLEVAPRRKPESWARKAWRGAGAVVEVWRVWLVGLLCMKLWPTVAADVAQVDLLDGGEAPLQRPPWPGVLAQDVAGVGRWITPVVVVFVVWQLMAQLGRVMANVDNGALLAGPAFRGDVAGDGAPVSGADVVEWRTELAWAKTDVVEKKAVLAALEAAPMSLPQDDVVEAAKVCAIAEAQEDVRLAEEYVGVAEAGLKEALDAVKAAVRADRESARKKQRVLDVATALKEHESSMADSQEKITQLRSEQQTIGTPDVVSGSPGLSSELEARLKRLEDQVTPPVVAMAAGFAADTWASMTVALGLEFNVATGSAFVSIRGYDNQLREKAFAKLNDNNLTLLEESLFASRVMTPSFFLYFSVNYLNTVVSFTKIDRFVDQVLGSLSQPQMAPAGMGSWYQLDRFVGAPVIQKGATGDYGVVAAFFRGDFSADIRKTECFTLLSLFPPGLLPQCPMDGPECAQLVLERFGLFLETVAGDNEELSWELALAPGIRKMRTAADWKWICFDYFLDAVSMAIAQWFLTVRHPVVGRDGRAGLMALSNVSSRLMLRDLLLGITASAEEVEKFKYKRSREFVMVWKYASAAPTSGSGPSRASPVATSGSTGGTLSLSRPLGRLCLAHILSILPGNFSPNRAWKHEVMTDGQCERRHITLTEAAAMKEHLLHVFKVWYKAPDEALVYKAIEDL